MANFMQLKNLDLEFITKSQYEETDSLPLMKSAFQVPIITLIYILFVVKIGPALMKNRKPYELRTALIAYNAFQVALSIYMFVIGSFHVMKHGFVYTECDVHDPDARNDILKNIWIFFAAKVTELLDTVFFVLRKKNNQISFLHVYHHSTTLFCTWAFLKWAPSDALIVLGAFNAAVHIVMYSYYGLAALGPHMNPYLKWKKHITSFQLVQFFVDFVILVEIVKNSECAPPQGITVLMFFNTFFYIYLFGNFYYKQYVCNNNKTSKSKLNVEKLN